MPGWYVKMVHSTPVLSCFKMSVYIYALFEVCFTCLYFSGKGLTKEKGNVLTIFSMHSLLPEKKRWKWVTSRWSTSNSAPGQEKITPFLPSFTTTHKLMIKICVRVRLLCCLFHPKSTAVVLSVQCSSLGVSQVRDWGPAWVDGRKHSEFIDRLPCV